MTERRRELLEIAREFDLMVVEDNPYGMLRFEGEPLPTLAALEQEEDGVVDRVVYLGTFSKIFAPGRQARVGTRPAGDTAQDQRRQAGRRPLLLEPLADDDLLLLPERRLARLRAGA